MEKASAFDPRRFLTKVGSADYLEVKWRLYWLRQEHPDATIETELVTHQNSVAVFRARVSIPAGGSATGWGSEGYDDFRDYLEKAETKALGRALAALGFGTQFTSEYDFGADRKRVVDSPVQIPIARAKKSGENDEEEQLIATINQPITSKQLNFVRAIARGKGMSDEQIDAAVNEQFGKALTELDRRDASVLIEQLQARESVARAS